MSFDVDAEEALAHADECKAEKGFATYSDLCVIALAVEVRRLRELDREFGHDQGCERGNCRRCQFEASTIQQERERCIGWVESAASDENRRVDPEWVADRIEEGVTQKSS